MERMTHISRWYLHARRLGGWAVGRAWAGGWAGVGVRGHAHARMQEADSRGKRARGGRKQGRRGRPLEGAETQVGGRELKTPNPQSWSLTGRG
jgi:hypothetical protein